MTEQKTPTIAEPVQAMARATSSQSPMLRPETPITEEVSSRTWETSFRAPMARASYIPGSVDDLTLDI